jgi:P4 family phage/plasmid primase-like protien
MSSLLTFLSSRRVSKDDPEYKNWNVTGIAKGLDVGCYNILEEDYDQFLNHFHNHVFGAKPMSSSLLERHRDVGPLLVDLDFRYERGGPLKRRFRQQDVKRFIAEYVAAMIYFSRVEDLPEHLDFYVTTKPMPEADGEKHKDGVHIQCPDVFTVPKYQYAIRGFLLQREALRRLFDASGNVNPAEETFDVAVIHRNNWFLYGSCKPNKAQYSVDKVWRISTSDIRDALDGGDPADVDELVDIAEELLAKADVSADSGWMLRHLSIRKATKATPLEIRKIRAAEWEELMIGWGSGKKVPDRSLPPPKNVVEFTMDDDGEHSSDGLVVADAEDALRAASTEDDIKLAYRLARDCLNAERRCGDYQDWVNVAICLKNIANSEESFKIWCELTRRVDGSHKKAHMTDAELRAKWGLIRIDNTRKLGIGSLHHWAREDNPDRHRSILSEHNTEWIISYASNTHVSIAECVHRLYEHEFRCCKGPSKQFEWYQFVGHHWKHLVNHTELRSRLSGRIKDEYIEAWRKLGAKANALPAESEQLKGIEEKRKTLRGIERNLEMASFKDSVMRECQEKFEDPTFLKKLNADPYLVGVSNGVLELQHYENEARTGRPHVYFRDGRPDDFVSFQMGGEDDDALTYEPYNASVPEQAALSEFFSKIYPDAVLREYVLTLLSSCLEGANKEQKFYVMQGVGSNGKSMIELLMELTFGDYGTSIGTQVFTRKRPDSGAANPDIITVQKRRYIHMGEPDDDEKINTSIMKQWTGGDRIAARGLFADQEKFIIMAKLFMSCNDMPPVNKMDNGTWRRLRVLPHGSVFKDPGDAAIDPSKHIYEKDLHLESKIPHWRTAFLSLLVHYYETHYLEHGLKEPACVMAASNKYKEENDVFNKFFEENFVRDSAAVPILAKEVKNIWRDWKRSMGRAIDLREGAVLDRMKEMCGAGSTDKEFFGIRVLDDGPDLSGALLRPV